MKERFLLLQLNNRIRFNETEGKTTESHITGMTTSFRYKDKLISHKSYVDDVESLISDFRKAKKVIKIPKIK